MRECIYCGKQLERGEQCTCAMSVAKRMERQKAESAADASAESSNDKGEQKERRKAEKREAKKRARQERRRQRESARSGSAYNGGTGRINKNAFANVWREFVSFVKSPIETVMNPGLMTKAEIMIFVVIEGVINGLGIFSLTTGAGRGPFKMLGNILGFKGFSGYGVILQWLAAALAGAVAGMILFFILTGIFYFITKRMFGQFVTFWDFAKRFAFVAIPSTVVGVVGVLLGFFSQTTLTVLMLSGMIGSVILIYEILRSMWSAKTASRTMYTMMAGMFVFLLVVLFVVRLAMNG